MLSDVDEADFVRDEKWRAEKGSEGAGESVNAVDYCANDEHIAYVHQRQHNIFILLVLLLLLSCNALRF